ncbi:hypothetical protein [Mycolicibacterium llatzerense]|uniref:hypothetical protein n=1 Tax=Mycolicibacterium llatzerense TaxID=280871 RepID=UPI0031D027BF
MSTPMPSQFEYSSKLQADFLDLADPEKVKFVETDLSAVFAELQQQVEAMEGFRIEVTDQDELIRFQLDRQGRMHNLQIAPDIGKIMDNLKFEKLLNELIADGTEAVREMCAAEDD